MLFRGIFLLAAASLPLMAGEYATFASGNRMKADRHERSGNVIRLFQGAGVIEVPAEMIIAIEEFEDAQPVSAAQPLRAVLEVPAPVETVAVRSNDPRDMIRDAALREGLPPAFVASVAKVESAFQPHAISPKGAIGVMQLMPGTAKALGADPYDVRQNIDAGTRLLRELLVKYEGDVVKALSAYNAGEGAVARYQGLPPYTETRFYVNKVIGAYQQAGGN
ncbi:MAG: lytic transglycosylase domain-containing protein [Acidobacteriota bacterium]